MTNIDKKYLRDENGNIISPVVSTGSVYLSTGETINKTILDNHFEEQTYKGTANCTTNGTAANPTSSIEYQSGSIHISVGGKLTLPEGYYEIIVSSRYKDTTSGADCSETLTVYDSSGKRNSTINIWERNFKRFCGYLDCIVYVPQNGYIQVDNYNDSNTSENNTVTVIVKKI